MFLFHFVLNVDLVINKTQLLLWLFNCEATGRLLEPFIVLLFDNVSTSIIGMHAIHCWEESESTESKCKHKLKKVNINGSSADHHRRDCYILELLMRSAY